ncbi:MAG: hypothetical protein JW795_22720 [Chitinivibrionales bacterium]|nr:hypothetical protein [Chitinivibrionales bacterium]
MGPVRLFRISQHIRLFALFFLLALCIVSLVTFNCAGGWDHDNAHAQEFKNSLFNVEKKTDTLCSTPGIVSPDSDTLENNLITAIPSSGRNFH